MAWDVGIDNSRSKEGPFVHPEYDSNEAFVMKLTAGDSEKAFETISRLLKKRGYLILEFANKQHLKATISEFIKGNFTFALDIFPKDLRSKRAKNKNTRV